MTINIHSTNRSPLTYTRENAQYRGVFGRGGVVSGCQFYRGTPASFRVSYVGGTMIINGMVIDDDQVTGDFFDFAALSGTDAHVLIYAKFNPDTDSTVEYKYTTGTHTVPAQFDPADAFYSIELCDVYIYSTSTSIYDAIIANRPVSYNLEDVSKYVGLKKFLMMETISFTSPAPSSYKIEFDGGYLSYISPFKNQGTTPANIPVGTVSLFTGTVGGDYEWEMTFGSTKDFIVLYVRGDLNNDVTWNGQVSAEIRIAGFDNTGGTGLPADLESLLGSATSLPTSDMYPDRANYSDITILGVVDQRNETLNLMNGIVLPVGATFVNGSISDVVKTVSSTEYGTLASPSSNDVDIDSVISNIGKLKSATLDTVYDGLDAASSGGDGRVINSDSGALEIRSKELTEGSGITSDKFLASLRVHMDYDENAVAQGYEKGIDVVHRISFDKNKALSFRQPIKVSGVDLTGISALLTYVGSQVRVAITGYTVSDILAVCQNGDGILDQDILDSLIISFDLPVTGGGGILDADKQYYKLMTNIASNYFYLSTTDGVTDLQSEVPAHFNTLPATETITVWTEHQFGPTVISKNLEVEKTISGREGGTVNILTPTITGFTNTQDLIENTAYGNVSMVTPADFQFMKSMANGYNTGVASDQSQRVLSSCGRYIYKLTASSIGVQITGHVLNVKDQGLVSTFTTTHNSTLSGVSSSAIDGDGQYFYVAYCRDTDDYLVVEKFDPETGSSVTLTAYSGAVGVNVHDIIVAGGGVFVATTDGYYLFANDTSFVATGASLGSNIVNTRCVDGYGSNMVAIGRDVSLNPYIDIFDSVSETVTSTQIDTFTVVSPTNVLSVACNQDHIAMALLDGATGYLAITTPALDAPIEINIGSMSAAMVRFIDNKIHLLYYNTSIWKLVIYDVNGKNLHDLDMAGVTMNIAGTIYGFCFSGMLAHFSHSATNYVKTKYLGMNPSFLVCMTPSTDVSSDYVFDRLRIRRV